MKVVINRCHGGFSLSPTAVRRLAELKGRPCYFFVARLVPGRSSAVYEPTTEDEAAAALCFFAADVPDINALVGPKDVRDQTAEDYRDEYERLNAHLYESRPDDRADPDLVRVVEELGEAANGAMASLKVVEVPDGVSFEIEEHAGLEHVAEVHRTWY